MHSYHTCIGEEQASCQTRLLQFIKVGYLAMTSGHYDIQIQHSFPNWLFAIFEQNFGYRDEEVVLVTRKPQWATELNGYHLNFKGRVKMSSTKNFQVIAQACPEDLVMQVSSSSQSYHKKHCSLKRHDNSTLMMNLYTVKTP